MLYLIEQFLFLQENLGLDVIELSCRVFGHQYPLRGRPEGWACDRCGQIVHAEQREIRMKLPPLRDRLRGFWPMEGNK